MAVHAGQLVAPPGLGAVVAEYFKITIFNNGITYVQSLMLILLASVPLSIFGLKYVLAITGGPIVFIGYPILITLTLCNIIYKIWGIGYIKIPTILTFIFAFASYVGS